MGLCGAAAGAVVVNFLVLGGSVPVRIIALVLAIAILILLLVGGSGFGGVAGLLGEASPTEHQFHATLKRSVILI